MKLVPNEGTGLRIAPRPVLRRSHNGHRSRASFLAAVEGGSIAGELRHLLEELLGPVDLEVIPQDGPLALARLRVSRPRLAFLSMDLRLMEGLTLLRALPTSRARQVVLLVPDTLEGYRRAWDGFYLGARDVLVTRGAPPQRLKGSKGARVRQLAHLLEGESSARRPDAVAGFDGAWRAEPAAGDGSPFAPSREAWVVLAESRHLPAVAAWLRGLPGDLPVLLRVPEGKRFARVAAEGLSRLLARPVRTIGDGDRLVPGHVHLLEDGKLLQIDRHGSYPRLRESAAADPAGSLCAQLTLLRRLAGSDCNLRVVLPDADPLDCEEFLAAGGGRHGLYRLASSPVAGHQEVSHGAEDAPGRLAA